MKSQESRVPPSPFAEPWFSSSVSRLLDFVDAAPTGISGELRFGDHGSILIHKKKICWAVATHMRTGLTAALRRQTEPALPRADIESVYRRCQSEQRSIVGVLLEQGILSQASLRRALLEHHGEAIFQLAQTFATPTSFVETRPGYDLRFAFSTAELLALSGASLDRTRAARAESELGAHLVAETTGAAFVRNQLGSGALVIAVTPSCELPLGELSELANRAVSLFDIADVFDPSIQLLRANCCDRTALCAWRAQGVCYVALCSSRPATARLMSSLAERLTVPSTHADLPRQRGAAR